MQTSSNLGLTTIKQNRSKPFYQAANPDHVKWQNAAHSQPILRDPLRPICPFVAGARNQSRFEKRMAVGERTRFRLHPIAMVIAALVHLFANLDNTHIPVSLPA